MLPKSNTLFHFTKSRETLKLVLKNGFWPRYCLEDVGWLGYETHDYVAYPMVCFCEIPLSRIEDHVGFYGEFGVGLSREWAETNGLNPVLYLAGENAMAQAFRETVAHSFRLPDKSQQEDALDTTRYLLAHVKPTAGTMIVDGEPVEKLFYQESEWRHVPRNKEIPGYLVRSSYDAREDLDEANERTKSDAMLRFNSRDIRYIFVKSDSDIPDVINFISSELDQIIASDQKILMSRVLSLESLREDL